MSFTSPLETLHQALLDTTELSLERQAYKKGPPSAKSLQPLVARCDELYSHFTQNSAVFMSGSWTAPRYQALIQTLEHQRSKFNKLLARLPQAGTGNIPLGSRETTRLSVVSKRSPQAVAFVVPAPTNEPIHIGMLRNACFALRSGHEKEGLAHIRALQEASPETAKKIFGKVYELAGSPTSKTNPKLAHPHFGQVAFYGKEKRNVSLEIKLTALETVLADLTTAPILGPRSLSQDLTSPRSTVHHHVRQSEVKQLPSARSEFALLSTEHAEFIAAYATKYGVVPFEPCGYSKRTQFLGVCEPCKIKFNGQIFKNVEEAFSAGPDPKKPNEFAKPRNLPGDFEGFRKELRRTHDHMKNVLYAAYTQNPQLRTLLLATGTAYLALLDCDGWGAGNGGSNTFGRLLMEVRHKLGGGAVVGKPPEIFMRMDCGRCHNPDDEPLA